MNERTVPPIDVTDADMEARTARFADMTPSPQPYLDTRISEHEREAFNVIGRGVTEDPTLAPAIAATEGFNRHLYPRRRRARERRRTITQQPRSLFR